MGLPAACTVRSNRMEKCPLMSEKELKKLGRGAMDYRLSDDGILIAKWYDNKEVTVATNCYSVEPTTLVKRWDKKKMEHIHIPCPAVIQAYNKGMFGVDHTDQMLAFYRIKTKSPKWYKRILYHFTDLALVNGFILRRGDGSLPLFQFKLDVALALMFAETFMQPLSSAAILLRREGQQEAKNGDPLGEASPPDAVRLDQQNHWPDNVAALPRRCKLLGCTGRSVTWCTKCRVYLCVRKNANCFVAYHTIG